MIRPIRTSLALVLCAACGAPTAHAATPVTPASEPATQAEIQALRQDMATLRAAYEAQLRALDDRLRAAEAGLAGAAVPAVPAPPPANSAAAANAFNPQISMILSGGYTHTQRDPAGYAIKGFALPADAEAGPGGRGFQLAETELGLAASIDPWLNGAANISLHPDNVVSVEEAYLQTTALSDGLALKAGRFLSGIGYLNAQHAHTWDFVDSPLAYQALLGSQYGDDGLQLHWLAPTDQFIEFGAELGRGRSYPGSDSSRNAAGMGALYAHSGGDLGDSQSWRAGLSWLTAQASDQVLAASGAQGEPVQNAFSGRTRVWIADAVWKWAPNGNATRTSFKLQGEYLRSQRVGSLLADLGPNAQTGSYRATQGGWYLQAVYQFLPGWRLGLRGERLDPGRVDYGINNQALASTSSAPRKDSLMLDYSASEFSRVRLQFALDRSRAGAGDRQIQLQYQMSLGAHGAHSY